MSTIMKHSTTFLFALFQLCWGVAASFLLPPSFSLVPCSYSPSIATVIRQDAISASQKKTRQRPVAPRLHLSHSNDNENDSDSSNDREIVWVDEIGTELPDELREQMESTRPSELTIMKDILGINIFTYVLAAAIAFFLGMNLVLGPGWLGSSIGIQGTGTHAFDNNNSLLNNNNNNAPPPSSSSKIDFSSFQITEPND